MKPLRVPRLEWLTSNVPPQVLSQRRPSADSEHAGLLARRVDQGSTIARSEDVWIVQRLESPPRGEKAGVERKARVSQPGRSLGIRRHEGHIHFEGRPVVELDLVGAECSHSPPLVKFHSALRKDT